VSDGHSLDRNAEARKRLGLKKGDMDGVPSVTARIVRGAGSVDLAIEALAGDESEDAQAFTEKWQSLSESDRARVSLEEVFTAAGLTARRFVEVVTGALMQQSGDVTRMMVAVAQPKVTQATIKAATESLPIMDATGEVRGWTNGDVKAMEMFHKATGFLPTPKGAQTTINLQQLNQTAQVGAGDDDESADAPQSMDDYLMELQDVIRPKELPAPKPEPMPVNAPQVDYLEV
jgi:hypothetical protein